MKIKLMRNLIEKIGTQQSFQVPCLLTMKSCIKNQANSSRIGRYLASGFTLVELMVTVSMAAILLGIAVPSFSNLIKDNRITTQINEFKSTLMLARSEAVKRGVQVTLCKSGDGSVCITDTSIDWSAGWIVFADEDNDEAHDSTEVLLKVQDAVSSDMTIKGDSKYQNFAAFIPDGQMRSGGVGVGGSITFCDDRGASFGKKLTIGSSNGRTKIDSTTDCG